jgi:hypothetical protein
LRARQTAAKLKSAFGVENFWRPAAVRSIKAKVSAEASSWKSGDSDRVEAELPPKKHLPSRSLEIPSDGISDL